MATIKRSQQTVDARLLLAYAGGTRFVVTRWKQCHHRWWVLDYLNQGQQPQRRRARQSVPAGQWRGGALRARPRLR